MGWGLGQSLKPCTQLRTAEHEGETVVGHAGPDAAEGAGHLCTASQPGCSVPRQGTVRLQASFLGLFTIANLSWASSLACCT